MSDVASPKAAAVLAAARALFHKHGMRRVSVEEVCARADVSKRTFYKYFRNKDDLAVRVLGELIEENRCRLEEALTAEAPIEEKARKVAEIKSALARETSPEFYHEVVAGDSAPARFVSEKQQEWDRRVHGFYAEAQARGEIRPDIDVDVLMFMLVRARDLVEDPGLARLQPDLSKRVESMMKLFFYGIVPRTGVSAETGP